MQNIDFYLHFNGNSEEAFSFYKSIFGGEFIAVQRYKEFPGSEKMSAEDQERIMHISLKITPMTTLMASDLLSADSSDFKQGNNYHIVIQVDNEKEGDKLFQALSKDGKIEMPMNKTFWGAYFGMCQDKFGLLWMISYAIPKI